MKHLRIYSIFTDNYLLILVAKLRPPRFYENTTNDLMTMAIVIFISVWQSIHFWVVEKGMIAIAPRKLLLGQNAKCNYMIAGVTYET